VTTARAATQSDSWLGGWGEWVFESMAATYQPHTPTQAPNTNMWTTISGHATTPSERHCPAHLRASCLGVRLPTCPSDWSPGFQLTNRLIPAADSRTHFTLELADSSPG
jgi:hypothetical protein